MRARIRAALAALAGLGLAFAVVAPVHAAAYDVGQHEHVAILNFPTETHPIARAPYTFHLDLKLHDMPAPTSYLRIDRDGGTTTDKLALVLGPAADLDHPLDWTIDFSGWSVGRHEMRWHLEIPDTGAVNGHKRQFTTGRLQVCVVSCLPSYRSGTWIGGGSWYGVYQIPLLTSTANAGGSFTARSQYSTSTSICAYKNPDFHHGSHGTILGCGSGTGNHTWSLADAVPGDNLVIVSRDAHQAGVIHVKVGDGSDPATFYAETQSWWSQAGLLLP